MGFFITGPVMAHNLSPIPVTFTTYAETRPWAAAIRTVVMNREMPLLDHGGSPGLLGDEGQLSHTDVETIVRWVENGAPEGEAPDAKNRRREK